MNYIIAVIGLPFCNSAPNGDSEEEKCIPVCEKKSCGGDNGCGGVCKCTSGMVCTEDGVCIVSEDTASPCDALGWECGTVEGISCGICLESERCEKGACVCEPSCEPNNCNADGCGDLCPCDTGSTCDGKGDCVDSDECKETCKSVGAVCGTVCDKSCGECAENESCIGGDCVCEPRCDGTTCADDGCGNRCECAAGTICDIDSTCIDPDGCEETCDELGYDCGTVCNEFCGDCSGDDVCANGVCICRPHCDGNTCGNDGCGGLCECKEGTYCDEDEQCRTEPVCEQTCILAAYECDSVCDVSCGACGKHEHCDNGACICRPECDGTSCGVNACGGICRCEQGTACNKNSVCVDADDCTDTCADAGYRCGEICGTSCGICEDEETCVNGACAPAVSCETCPLVLSLLSKTVTDDRVEIDVAIDYQSAEERLGVRMLDLHLRSDPPMRIVDVEEGDVLISAGKKLSIDPSTKKKWFGVDSDTRRFLVMSASNTEFLATGRLLVATLETTADVSGTAITLALVRRNQVFAPEDADSLLQISPYDTAVSIPIE